MKILLNIKKKSPSRVCEATYIALVWARGGAGGGFSIDYPTAVEAGCFAKLTHAIGEAGKNRGCGAHRFLTNRARMALRTARTMTPTSAKMASHMLARPRAPRTRHRAFTPMAKTMFW